jgi:plasmid stabilization system protein ParE
MKIIWSDFATGTLLDIYQYYKLKASPTVARKIKTDILETTKQLIKHPYSGQVEFTLEKLKEGHRYLVKGNYKIIYKEVAEGILITDVFDTRQDPVKMNDEKRNSNK